MTITAHSITLSSDRHFGRNVPAEAIGQALLAIPMLVRHSVSMAFRGRSAIGGARPRWLESAADVRFIDHFGDDQTVLVFQAPTLGTIAPELYEQNEPWPARPDPGLTAFDLLADIVREVAAQHEDSDRFDRGLLGQLARCAKLLDGSFRDLTIETTLRGMAPAVIDAEVIQTALRFRDSTPPPQRVRVLGTLVSLRASTQSFVIRLDDNQEVPGVLTSADPLNVVDCVNSRVLVIGKAVYRASGRLLRIDSDEITTGERVPAFFSRIPAAKPRKFDLRRILRVQGHKKGVAAIIGQWPGDETDEEIVRALEEIS
jgi:hypothetical protein